MADHHGETIVVLELKDKRIELGEIEFLLYASFVIRCKKEVEWLDYRTFDPVYLEFILAVDLPYLTGTCREKKYLRELKVFVGEGECVAIEDSRHYNMIQSGNIPELEVTTNLSNQTYDESLL